MGIVVEIIGRNGSVIRSQAFDREKVTIGRAYNCDVILKDAHVDATHLVVTLDETTQRLVSQDVGTLNGSWVIEPSKFDGLQKNKRRIKGETPLFSGQAFLLGHTYLRIYSANHWVAPTQALSAWEDFGHLLGRYWLVALLCLLVVTIEMWGAYLKSPETKRVFQYALSGLYPVLGAALYALVWAVVSKTIKHDTKYLTFMSVGLISIGMLMLIKLFLPLVIYALGIGVWEAAVNKLLLVLVGYCCLSATFTFASNLKPLARRALAICIPLAFLIPFSIDLLTKPDFRGWPAYDYSLAGPFWAWRTPISQDKFLEIAETVYTHNFNDTKAE